MHLHVIGARPHAIAYLLSSGTTRVLVDCGLPARMMRARLSAIGLDPLSIDAVVLTHEHGGHACGLGDHPFRDDIAVVASEHTCRFLGADAAISRVRWLPASADLPFAIGDLVFRGWPVAHDAVDPFAWLVEERGSGFSIGITGDLGHVSRQLIEMLLRADCILVHANHDEELLRADQSTAPPTRLRAANRHGHLSNEQAADLVAQLALRGRLGRVLLSHLDPRWNTPRRTVGAVEATLAAIARPEIPVRCLRNGETHCLSPRGA
jgi:phosphoribosyl 1,2-cyclic phosphodiesterase